MLSPCTCPGLPHTMQGVSLIVFGVAALPPGAGGSFLDCYLMKPSFLAFSIVLAGLAWNSLRQVEQQT